MIIPRKIGAPRHPSEIQVSPEIMEVSVSEPEQVYQKLKTSNQGLTEAKAAQRLKEYGPNVVAQDKRYTRLRLLGRALVNPLVILLSILAIISVLTGDLRAATVMAAMVVLGVVLRFVQEARADTAAAKLKAMISVNATVIRDGETKEIPLAKLVPGDVVHLAAGDMIPADVRIISCKELFVIQASLTGESFPVEKHEVQEAGEEVGLLELKNICFLGTSVERGTSLAVDWWKRLLFRRSEPQDVALELRSAAMAAVGSEDVHQFPDLKPGPAREDIQDRRLNPEVQVKIEVGYMPILCQPNPDVFIQVGFHVISPC